MQQPLPATAKRVERTLLSAAFDFDFCGRREDQNQHRRRRTGVSALHSRNAWEKKAVKW